MATSLDRTVTDAITSWGERQTTESLDDIFGPVLRPATPAEEAAGEAFFESLLSKAEAAVAARELHPVPKPTRAPRLEAQHANRLQRRSELKRASTRKHATSYGVAKGATQSWPEFKAAILARDGRRCVMCAGRLGLAVHHLKSVGSGGKNDPQNAATLCCRCHDDAHTGHLAGEAITERLIELHGSGAVPAQSTTSARVV